MSRPDDRTSRSARSRPGASELRVPGRRFDRLTVRLALGIALLVIGPVGGGFYLLSTLHFDQKIAANRNAAEIQNRLLEIALRHQMVERDTTVLTSVLEEIGTQPHVRAAMILDHAGEIRIASDSERVGEVIPQDSPACAACHSRDSESRDRWVVLDIGGEEVLRSVLPIENRAECHRCHSPEDRLNGILILDTSLGPLQAELDREFLSLAAAGAVLVLLLLTGVGLFVRRLILSRLRDLGGAARSFAAGELGTRATVAGDDVISSLAGDFNGMAEAVSALIGDIRDQEAQLESIVNSLDDGLVVLDSESRVVAANRSFGIRLGRRPEALHGLRCHESVGNALPCCESGAECPAALCMATGEVQRAVFSAGRAGERDVVEEVHASPVFDESGGVVRVVEIWRDISERVEEERHLAEIEHLVALGTLASGFSHEVNTPMASVLTCAESVLGQLEELERDGRPTREVLPSIEESARTIREQILRCRRITEQFLRFSRGIPPSIEPLDLRQAVAGVVSLVGPTAREAGVDIAIEGTDPLPAVRANTEVVQHAILNLLVNAIQSCEDGRGSVVVEFRVDDQVRIRLTDDGCGIPRESRAHLFEPFQSRKPGGTGLGLFLSRSFLRRFGGDVRLVESRVGVGSCFEVSFARTAEGPE